MERIRKVLWANRLKDERTDRGTDEQTDGQTNGIPIISSPIRPTKFSIFSTKLSQKLSDDLQLRHYQFAYLKILLSEKGT